METLAEQLARQTREAVLYRPAGPVTASSASPAATAALIPAGFEGVARSVSIAAESCTHPTATSTGSIAIPSKEAVSSTRFREPAR